MRLRTFESFWLLKNGLLYTYPTLQKNIKTEILVIGGGITGALISDALMDAGYEVTLIDRRDIGQGSTSATTSMLQYEIDEPLKDLAKKIGEEAAALCYQEGITAIQDLEQLVKTKKLNCGFQMKKSLYIAHNKTAAKELYQEFEIRKKYQLGVKWLEPDAIKKTYGIVSQGGILSDTAASVDAYQMAHELIAFNVKRGMKVFDQTEIKSIQDQGRFPKVITQENYTINAQKIVFCTGFESLNLLKEKVADLIYTYATVSEPTQTYNKNLEKILIWDTQDPYLYMRTTDDGRFLVGGEDSVYKDTILQQKIKEEKSKTLIKKIKKTLPDLDFIEDISWGGIFGTTKDGLPYIGESPEYKNCLFCLGFGGNGITFSTQGRKIIVDLLQNKENVLAEYYRFGR